MPLNPVETFLLSALLSLLVVVFLPLAMTVY